MILATLTVLSARAIQQAIFTKAKVQTQVDEMGQVRDALKIIERDVNLAFHYRDIEEEFRAAVSKTVSTTPTPAGGAPGGFGAPPPNFGGFGAPGPGLNQAPDPADQRRKANRADPETHFEGTSEEMDFVTMNAGRIADNDARADFLKVGYKVTGCKRLSGKQESTKCLMRKSSPWVEGKVKDESDEGGIVLLENVSEFKLRYFGKGKQDWNDTWSSKENPDATTRGAYPSAVEISLTVENGAEATKKRKISMQIVAMVRHPNNKPAATPGLNNPGAPTQ